MKAFVVYSRATGAVLYRAADPNGAAGQADNLATDQAAMDIPFEAIISDTEISLVPVRVVLATAVDHDAELARNVFQTPGDGQAMTYLYKAAEAKAWKADPSSDTPFLVAEANARGMTIDALVDEVLHAVADWTRIGAAIEAARMKAKRLIGEANDFAALASASIVDWMNVVGPPPAAPALDDEA